MKLNLPQDLDAFNQSYIKKKNNKLAKVLAKLKVQNSTLREEKLRMQAQLCALGMENNMLKQSTNKIKNLVQKILQHTLIISSEITSYYREESHLQIITDDHNSDVRMPIHTNLERTKIAGNTQCFHPSRPESESQTSYSEYDFDDNSSFSDTASNVESSTSPENRKLLVIEEESDNDQTRSPISNNVRSCNSDLSCTNKEVNATADQKNYVSPIKQAGKLHTSYDIVTATNKSKTFDINQNRASSKKKTLRSSKSSQSRIHSRGGTFPNTSPKSEQEVEEQTCGESSNHTNDGFSNNNSDRQEKENVPPTCVQEIKDCSVIIEKIDKIAENVCISSTEQSLTDHEESPQSPRRFPRRCALKVINFKEPSLIKKMRRD